MKVALAALGHDLGGDGAVQRRRRAEVGAAREPLPWAWSTGHRCSGDGTALPFCGRRRSTRPRAALRMAAGWEAELRGAAPCPAALRLLPTRVTDGT